MKIRSIIITMALAAIAAACNKPEIVDPSAEGLAPQLLPNQFSATFETSSSEDAKSKVSMNEDYSLSWVQGDAVSVFDAEGTNLLFTAKESGKSTALDGGEVVVDPEVTYYAVYPYSENNSVADGRIIVEMPVVQTPVQGSFPTNVSVAKSDQRQLKFYNVCGLLGFEITQEDIVSVSVKSAGAQEYLTGKVAVDCSDITNPTYEVLDGVTEVTLVAEGTFATGVHYVSVLPQTFTGLTITMFKADGKVASVTSLAGFTFTLERSRYLETGMIDTGNFSDEKILTITNAAELQGFLAAADSYAAEDVVTIANDIDLKGYDLVPATSFAGTLTGAYTDGEETKNRALKNWNTTTALFETLSGEVRNVTVDATSSLVVQPTGDAAFIALNNAGTIDGCINNGVVTSVSETFTSTAARMVGTMAAVSTGTISNCVNNASITLTPKSVNKAAFQFVGGIVGQAGGATAEAEFISGCQNNGTVAFDAVAYSCKLFIGGVLGGTPVGNKTDGFGDYGVVKDCTNKATVSVSCDGYSSQNNYLNLGGVVGYAEADVDNCDNSGAVTVAFQTEPTGKSTNYLRPAVGGVAGDVLYNVTNCDNTGTLTVTGAFASTANEDAGEGQDGFASFGGVVAIAGSSASDHKVTACTNSGAMNLDIHMFAESPSHGNIGGVVGNAIAAVSDCQNSGAGLTVKNRMRGGRVGGIVGITNAAIKNSDNSAPIDYDMVVTAENGNQSKYVDLGGVAGQLNSKASNVITYSANTGNITIKNGWKSGEVSTIGGLIGKNTIGRILGGESGKPIESIRGTYKITTSATIYFGGIVGMTGAGGSSKGLYNFERRGKSIVTEPGEGSRIGAICGVRFNATQADAIVNLVASADEFTCSSAATDIYAGLFYGEYTTSAADMYVHTCTLNAGSPVVTNMTACGIAVGKLTSGTMLLGKGTGNKFTIRPLTFNGKTYSAGYSVTESDLKGAGDGTVSIVNVVVEPKN